MLKNKRTIIFALLLITALVSNAQQSRVNAAYTFLQQGNLDSAKAIIDVAVKNAEISISTKIIVLLFFNIFL